MKRSSISAFFLAVILYLPASAQQPTPGGVEGAELWFKTVAVTAGDMQGKYKWEDFGGDGVKLKEYNSAGADQGTEYTLSRGQIRTYNFNPAMEVTRTGYRRILLKHNNLSQASILGVFGTADDFDKERSLYRVEGRAGAGIVATKSKIIKSNESGQSPMEYGKEEGKNLLMADGLSTAEQHKYQESVMKSMTYYRSMQPNHSVWGEKRSSDIRLGTFQNSSNNDNSTIMGVPDNFEGYIPEFIVYGRILTPLERRKIETYLAVKYAFTLDMSYISNNGELVWDMEQNKEYNHRITGVAREDSSGLYQEFSASSQEEATYFSYTYDTYEQNNSNRKATPYRLLFAGRQNASPMGEGEYILWGDNNAPISTTVRSGKAGIKIMQRQWLLKTHKPSYTAESQNLDYKTAAITVENQNFTATITKSKDDAQVSGTLVTVTALKTKNGYFCFDTSFSLKTGTIEIKFGTANASATEGSHDYGYHINSNGYIYRIIKGKTDSSLADIAYTGNKIEIEKTQDHVYLWVNGNRQEGGTIKIEEADRQKTYYGSLLINKGTENIVLNHFRHGGFTDTGNRLELSYISKRAEEFKDYRKDGRAYLIIDRSGTGSFPEGQTDYYPADDLDEGRYKIIFNNIFWDTDVNGKDIFTFGYRAHNLVAEITGINPSCDPKSGEALEDGKIEIQIKHGYPGYTYTLTDKSVQSIIKSGRFYTDKYQIENLKAGVYLLNIKEIGGTNLLNPAKDTPTPTATTGVSLTSNTYSATSTTAAAVEFTAIDDSSYDLGFTTATSNASAQTINYGVKVENYNLYAISEAKVSEEPSAQFKAEDRIRIERTSKSLTIKINDKVVFYTDGLKSNTAALRLGANQYGEGRILNIKVTSSKTLPSWKDNTTGVITEESDSEEITEEITLRQDCGVVVVTPPVAEKDTPLLIYYKQSGSMSEETVRVTLEQSSAANLLVYSMNGAMVYQDEHKDPRTAHEFDIKGLPVGAYIVKVITNSGEYSGRLLIQAN